MSEGVEVRIDCDFPKKLLPLFEPRRYKVLYGGRGSGKSWGVARALLLQCVQQPLRVLCAREIQRTIADSVHRLLSDQIAALELDWFFTITDGAIKGNNGSEFLFTGLRAMDAAKIKSYEGIDVAWVEEAQVVSKKSWDILIPTIRAEGSEIWVTFNPEMDSDDTYKRFVVNPPPDAWVQKLSYADNKWFPEVLDRERLHQRQVDPVSYENVWEGQCKSVVDGAIYAGEVLAMIEARRVRPVPYDPMLKVHTIWDMGWNDQMTIILAQRMGGEVRIIDYIEDSHRILTDYLSELERCKYSWGKDWLPHDGNAADYKTGKSAKEILTGLGRRVEIIPRMDVETGIQAARMMFPRVYMDETDRKCDTGFKGPARLLDCLRRYRRAIPQSTGEPGAPVHDEYSHGADAFRGLAMCIDKMTNDEQKKRPKMASFEPLNSSMGY